MHITGLRLQGFRAFQDSSIQFSPLEVIVGANGSGKTSLLEFLRFLRNLVENDIPPYVLVGSAGQRIFHDDTEPHFDWDITWDNRLHYSARLLGLVGQPILLSEKLVRLDTVGRGQITFITRTEQQRGTVMEPESPEYAQERPFGIGKPNQSALNVLRDTELMTISRVRDYMLSWRFYSGFEINKAKVRSPALVEQTPILDERFTNLSAMLHFLMTENRPIFEDLEQLMRQAIPGFEYLTVKARGAPGEVLAFWKEQGIEDELSIADMSDGMLRLLAWMVLCLQPNPPGLICIDEPDQGIHPRALNLLAGLFQKVSHKTQVLLVTHNSHFLTQFNLENIAVMRKEKGNIEYLKPDSSETLKGILEDFGLDEIERMHRSSELETFS